MFGCERNWTSNFQHFNSWQSDIFYSSPSFFFVPCHFFLTRRQQRQIELCLGLESRLSKEKRVERVFVPRICPDIITLNATQQWESKKLLSIYRLRESAHQLYFGWRKVLMTRKFHFRHGEKSFPFDFHLSVEVAAPTIQNEKKERERKCNSQSRPKKTPMKIGKVIIKLAVIIFCVVCAWPCLCWNQNLHFECAYEISDSIHTHTPFSRKSNSSSAYLTLYCMRILLFSFSLHSHYHYHHTIDFPRMLESCFAFNFSPHIQASWPFAPRRPFLLFLPHNFHSAPYTFRFLHHLFYSSSSPRSVDFSFSFFFSSDWQQSEIRSTFSRTFRC